jgi:acetyl-CoA carboxylase biotin carboxyl carrier protein
MSSPHQDDLSLIKALVDTLSSHELTSISYKKDDLHITLKKQGTPPHVSHSPVSPPSPPPNTTPQQETQTHTDEDKLVRSKIVGTVYLSPSPDAKPFIKSGDTVKKGDVILIIETMKIMNNIAAPRDGIIDQVLVGDAEPVEYNQPLVTLL